MTPGHLHNGRPCPDTDCPGGLRPDLVAREIERRRTRSLRALSAADAHIDTALHSAREAMTGYVAQETAPERSGTTDALFDALSLAVGALVTATGEVNRLLNKSSLDDSYLRIFDSSPEGFTDV